MVLVARGPRLLQDLGHEVDGGRRAHAADDADTPQVGGQWRFPVRLFPGIMHFPTHEQKQALLEQVMRIADQHQSGAQAQEARAFIALYYEQIDPEDLASRSPEDLYGAAVAHLQFARQFASGTPKIHVYNPRTEEHGWSSPHTVIEMVNDDMPFLVDSVTMEVNRQGYAVHLLNHPLFATQRDKAHMLTALGPSGGEGQQESLIHLEVDRELDPAKLKELGAGIVSALQDVRASVEDWAT